MTTLKPAVKVGSKFQNPVQTEVGGLGMIAKLLPLYLRNKEERVPRKQLGPFQTNAGIYTQPSLSGLRITWMGHSCMLLEMDGIRILIDPVWDERASPFGWAGPKRFFAAPLALTDLPPLDVVLVSHDHYDHLGKQTVKLLSNLPQIENAKWVTSCGVGNDLSRFGVASKRIVELNWTECLVISDQFTITALPARHFSGRSLSSRFETLWSAFAITSSRHNVYYGADSGLWNGLNAIGQHFGPFDLTMLEIGAYHELWKSIHMGPDGAAEAFSELGKTGLLMPIHWGLFDLALHAWYQPIQRMMEAADTFGIKLWTPEPGVPSDVVKNQEYRSDWWRKYLTETVG